MQSLFIFRNEIDEILNPTAVVSNPLLLTKLGVLTNIDMVILNAIPNLTISALKQEQNIQIIPLWQSRANSVFTIQSATQGSNGSVFIEKNGLVSYKPNSGKKLDDQFTVTIKDAEGDTIVKTIKIVAQAGCK